MGLNAQIVHFTAGAKWCQKSQAQSFLRTIESIVHMFAGCGVMLYQAGADPHIDDPLGGWLTTEEIAERDRIVFTTAAKLGIPVAWNLAGGYQTPLRRVLDIHDNALPNSWLSNSSVVSAWNADKSRLSDHSGMVVEVLL